MSAHNNAALVRTAYEYFNNNQLDQVTAMATEDIEVLLVPFDQTFHGRDGFKAFMQGFKTAFPDLTITVTNQVATEEQVVSECEWRGTHTGPLQSPAGEIPPTSKEVEGARFCEVWRIRDGQIAALHNYQDVSSWLRQLGLGS